MDHNVNGFHQIILAGGEPRWSEYTGTKALMMAVLEISIRDYCGLPGPPRTEAECWVRSNRRGAFSFAVICETLGLEPTAVRQALVRLKNQAALPSGPIRADVRTQKPTANLR